MELALSHSPGERRPVRRPDLRLVSSKVREPGWANGLRDLYNTVLNEPLPGSFDDLLKKFDDPESDG